MSKISALLLAALAIACRRSDQKPVTGPVAVVQEQPPAPVFTKPSDSISDRMALWGTAFRPTFLELRGPLYNIESGDYSRETCNAILRITFNARGVLPPAPDTDIQKSVVSVLGNLESAGHYCLQNLQGATDLSLMLAAVEIGLIGRLTTERYSVPGLPDIARFGTQESQITLRALRTSPETIEKVGPQ